MRGTRSQARSSNESKIQAEECMALTNRLDQDGLIRINYGQATWKIKLAKKVKFEAESAKVRKKLTIQFNQGCRTKLGLAISYKLLDENQPVALHEIPEKERVPNASSSALRE